MRRILLGMSGILVLVFSGIVHGVWTDRWSDRSDLVQAAVALSDLPLVLGDWEGIDLEQGADRDTALAGTLSRRYTHRATGKVVSIYFGCGRSGPASVHTPEVCFAGSGYEVERPMAIAVPQGANMPKGEFWTARFVKEKAAGRTSLRLFWAWNARGEWKVSDNPRVAFAGERLLHKLYLIREMSGPDEAADTDPSIEFMRELLPALQATCFRQPPAALQSLFQSSP